MGSIDIFPNELFCQVAAVDRRNFLKIKNNSPTYAGSLPPHNLWHMRPELYHKTWQARMKGVLNKACPIIQFDSGQ